MPDVGHPGGRFWEQHRAHNRRAIAVQPRRPVRLDDRDVTAEPSGVVAAARKAETRGYAIAALDDARLAGSRTPGEDAARRPKDFVRRCRLEIGRGHRAARSL